MKQALEEASSRCDEIAKMGLRVDCLKIASTHIQPLFLALREQNSIDQVFD